MLRLTTRKSLATLTFCLVLLVAACVTSAKDPLTKDATAKEASTIIAKSCVELPTSIAALKFVFVYPNDDVVEVRWVAENVKDVSAEYLIYAKKHDVKPPLNKFTLTKPTNGWPEGLYRVDILHEGRILHAQRYLLVPEQK